jgi:hypothetical protein
MRKILSIPFCFALLFYSSASADLMTTFDEGSLPAGVGLDIPSAAHATITLDTLNEELDFTTLQNTDMWTTRRNAPVAWTARPTVNMGDTWYAETHVRYNGAANGLQRVAGLQFYPNTDGTGGSTDGVDFGFGINDWDDRSAELQGWGGTTVGDTGLQFINALAAIGHVSEIHLRIEVTENGASDLYTAFYKQNQPDAWTQLAQFSSGQDNSRVGLYLKTGNATLAADRSASFTYFNVGNVIPEPSSSVLFGMGAILLGLVRRVRRP